jgi:osmoprotectant transport system substrate-binding protein
MRHPALRLLGAVFGLALFAAACGGTSNTPTTTAKGTVTVGSFNFSESAILGHIYGGALKAKGWTVKYRDNLGNREVVEPALERGDIDLYPGYAATELEFQNKGKGEATPDAGPTVSKLNTYLDPKGLKALNASPAVDQNAFAVSKNGKWASLKKLSDLAPVGSQLTLGGPPECPTRPFCQAGLEKTYGIHFKAFKALDVGGPLTKAALDKGDIDVGLITSSDSAYATGKYVQLEDDKHLQNADAVTPLVRTKTVTSDADSVLNDVSSKLNTDDLIAMNKKADVDKQDPDAIAADWLKSHGYGG